MDLFFMSKLAARSRQYWLLVALAMTFALTCAVSTVEAATTIPPNSEYSVPRLDPSSQLPYWQNLVPNALADYYTYMPLSHEDAVKLGFLDYTGPDPLNPGNPITHSCGNKAITTGPDIADNQSSTNDCYVITVKRFTQPLSLAPFFGPTWGTPGLKAPNGSYYGDVGNSVYPNWTDVYGYGSGGANWTPPQFVYDPGVIPSGIRPKNPATDGPLAVVQGNAPTPFFNGAAGSNTAGLVTSGIWHFPAPTIKGTKGRSVRVQWLNELPNLPIPGFDPTVDCSDAVANCFPYNRIVTHVHGAHVGPASDGLAHAGFNPDFSNVGTKFSLTIPTATVKAANPPGTYIYPMDQEASTIWYHDHAVGTTHLNTNQGMAGFFPITDSNEQSLVAGGVLPTGAYELGFALQDRVFGSNDGNFVMPDAPVIDGKFPSCDATDAASRLATCSPLFMYASHGANASSLTTAGVHLVPYDEFTMENIPQNAVAPVLATSATLEFFGNMPVVNGVVYGNYNVEPTVYRMRFIGGTDSRTWSLQLQDRATLTVIPFWQIGSEQGFLKNPVQRQDMLLMPGERLDVLVDFTGLAPGAKVVLNNLATDAPYQGESLTPFNRSKNIPEIMEFTVVVGPGSGAAAPNAGTVLNTISPLTATAGLPIRTVALEEIVDEYQRIMPTIDRRGYDLPGIPATEIITVNNTEIWDVINTTADAHPMHLHQVAFQIVHRQPFTSFTPATNDTTNGVFSAAAYTAGAGTAVAPDPHDAGWKDTAYMPPGIVTRVIAKFDLLGEYVWHCHILSHEEHDMMRPMKIVASALNPPASLAVAASTPNNRTTTVTVAPATPANPVAEKFYVEYKKLADTNWTTNLASGTSQTITFPGDGTYLLRVKAVDAAISPTYSDSTYTPGSNTIEVWPSDSLTPTSGTLSGASQTFTVTASSGNYKHSLWVSAVGAGKYEFGRYNNIAGALTFNVTGLPTNSQPVYVRLWVSVPVTLLDGSIKTEMRYKDFTYTAAAPNVSKVVAPSSLTVPANSTKSPISIYWWKSPTPGVTYVLEESASGNFTTDVIVAYSGSANYVTVSVPASRTYNYRVKATLAGWTDSAYNANGVKSCVVTLPPPVLPVVVAPGSLTVPATSTKNPITVYWFKSPTPGITYILEESPSGLFNGDQTAAYTGSANYVTVPVPTSRTYNYRVKATLAGWTD
ncbi:MAG: multicopper oxidase domain-containing protein, partial [Geobacteraceae bacterium]|nr:multicopper oxidase domain-containing protein [Geobacteraceae bacterium]